MEASVRKTKRGGRYCVAGAPNNQSCTNSSYSEGITMHQFPVDPVIREKWVKFVHRHRRDFGEPVNKYAALCSAHFEDSCYERRPLLIEGMAMKMNKILIKGSVPTRATVIPASPRITKRAKRQLKRDALSTITQESCKRTRIEDTADDINNQDRSSACSAPDDEVPSACQTTPASAPDNEIPLSQSTPISTSFVSKKCAKCMQSNKKCKTLNKKCLRLHRKVRELKQRITELQSRVVDTETEEDTAEEDEIVDDQPSVQETTFGTEYSTDDSTSEAEDVDYAYASMEESTEDSSKEDEDVMPENEIRVEPDTPFYDEPKFIVFRSQPAVNGRYPAGNLLLSMATLLAGASVSKVALICRHMGLCTYAIRTYFRHQRHLLFPTILHHWESFQNNAVTRLRSMKDTVWCGDRRFDSMGHSAKYGVYTMFCTTLMKICHFEVVQANETSGSQQTELEGCKRSFSFLSDAGLAIPVFISDRHKGIAKWIRETCTSTVHFYDIWHVARTVSKKLLKASKEKGCKAISPWIKPIRNHLYWCATSTKQGFGALIAAKWSSFMRHLANRHSDHPDPLYRNCKHGPLEPRKWIKIGTAAYDKVHSILMKTSLVNDIKKLSPDAQTSSLEGFHATLNHWHPKMICFSWMGTVCRHILASLHFNENLHCETQTTQDGSKYIRVTFPKYKLGEEVVREVTCPPTYGYADSIKKSLFTLPRPQMREIWNRYHSMAPESLTEQFPDRASRAEAVKNYEEKHSRGLNTLFPDVEKQNAVQQTVNTATATKSTSKKARFCRTCKQPMRGHSKKNCQPNE